MVIQCNRCTEQRHETVPQKLVDRAFVAMHRFQCEIEQGVQDVIHALGTQTLCQGRGISDVAEEHRHLLALALERATVLEDAVRQMRADRFEDLIALVALYRPGPMANIPTYCARKLGKEPIEYLHPKLEPILKETFGVITYQEQVQQIAKDMAGYTLAEADLLRRAMGKKIKAEMDAQREAFVSGSALHNGIDAAKALSLIHISEPTRPY